MKLEHLFLGLCFLLIIFTGGLAFHYRTEWLLEKQRTELSHGPSAAPQMQPPAYAQQPAAPAPRTTTPPSLTPAPAPATADIDQRSVAVDSELEKLREQVKAQEAKAKAAEAEARLITNKAATNPAAITPAPAGEPLNEIQSRIAAAPAIAKVKSSHLTDGFVVLDQGSGRNLTTGQDFAIRRGHVIIAKRITVGETVSPDECIADVNPKSLELGVDIKPGDEIIKLDGL